MSQDRFKEIKGIPGMVKDTVSGGVLNIDNTALAAYKKRKALMKDNQERITNLENDLSEMKSMMKMILEKLS